MAAKSIYRRLTGRRRAVFGYSQLWLAPEHLLLVKSTRLAETYQRFALADIQAILVTELPDRTATQVWMAVAAILWTAAALTATAMFVKVFFLFTGAVAIAGVLLDVTLGPRCRCHLYTAVSRERLEPVSRVRIARRFLAEIRPAIEAAQGRLETTPAEAPSGPTAEAPPEVPRAPSYLPEIVFGLFLVDAALVLANLYFPRNQIGNALPTTLLAEIVLLIVALVRRAGRDARRVIYAVMFAALVCIGWDVVNLGRSLFALLMEAAQRPDPGPLVTSWEPLAHGEAVFAAAWRIVAGTVGLVSSYLSRTV